MTEIPGQVVRVHGDTHKSARADLWVDPTSAGADTEADHAVDLEAIAQGLMRLGVGAARSRAIVRAVVDALPRDELTEANVLRHAVASI